MSANPLPETINLYHNPRFAVGLLARHELLCRYRQGVLNVTYRMAHLSRHTDTVTLLAEAIGRLGVRDLPRFFVHIGDRPILKYRYRRAFTRFGTSTGPRSSDVPAPDFIFVRWPEAQFEDFDAEAATLAAAGAAPALYDKALWIGRPLNPYRETLMAIGKANPTLIDAVDATAEYDWRTHSYAGRFVTLAEQIHSHRYMIDVEGNGFSGRLKLFLHSGRVVLLQQHPWHEWFFPLMEPYRHFVPVKRDLSDLVDRIEWLKANPQREREIADEAQRFARTHLTREAAVNEWVKLLQRHIQARGFLKHRWAGRDSVE